MCRSIAVQRVGVASLLRSDRCSHHRRCSCNQSTPLPPLCQGSSANRYEGVRSILRSASSTAYAGIRGTPLTPLGSISRLRPRDVRFETLILCILYETFIHLCTPLYPLSVLRVLSGLSQLRETKSPGARGKLCIYTNASANTISNTNYKVKKVTTQDNFLPTTFALDPSLLTYQQSSILIPLYLKKFPEMG